MTIEVRNALIQRTMLGIEDHGLTTAFLYLIWDGAAQGFGGYNFGTEDRPNAACGLFIRRVLNTLDVDTWEQLPGRHVRIAHDAGRIHRIGHIIKDQWFDPAIDLKSLAT